MIVTAELDYNYNSQSIFLMDSFIDYAPQRQAPQVAMFWIDNCLLQ